MNNSKGKVLISFVKGSVVIFWKGQCMFVGFVGFIPLAHQLCREKGDRGRYCLFPIHPILFCSCVCNRFREFRVMSAGEKQEMEKPADIPQQESFLQTFCEGEARFTLPLRSCSLHLPHQHPEFFHISTRKPPFRFQNHRLPSKNTPLLTSKKPYLKQKIRRMLPISIFTHEKSSSKIRQK